MTQPTLIAHRGYTLHYPENTLIGVEAAIATGARYVEIDVNLSADRVPVLFHDRSLRRLCGVDGAINEYSLEQLRDFRTADSERFGYKFSSNPITLLAEFAALLQQHPEVQAFVELKRQSIDAFDVETVVADVLEVLQPVAQQCIIISYSLESLLDVRHKGWGQIGAVIDNWAERDNAMMQRLEPDYFFCDIESLPRFGHLEMEGVKLAVYETVDPKQAMEVAQRGIEFVETFAIGEMLEAIEILSYEYRS